MSSLPQCTRCGLKAAQGGRSKCANCGFAYGQQFEQTKGTTSGPVTPTISDLPKCKRCGTIGKGGHKNCVFCGLAYGSDAPTGSDKKTGVTHAQKSQLPKCSQCGSWGKLNTDKCPFCYKPYGDSDYGGSAPSGAGKKCNRCGSKGIREGDLKCAYCGFTLGEAWTGALMTVSTSGSTHSGSTPVVKTTSKTGFIDTKKSTDTTTSTGTSTVSYETTSNWDTSAPKNTTGSGFIDTTKTTSEAPSFCGVCGSPNDGGQFCGVCGEAF